MSLHLNLRLTAAGAVINGVGFRLVGLSPAVGAIVGAYATWNNIKRIEKGSPIDLDTIIGTFFSCVYTIAPLLAAESIISGQRLNSNILKSCIIPAAVVAVVSFVVADKFDCIRKFFGNTTDYSYEEES